MADGNEERKKISLYLHPEDAADRRTLAIVENVPRKIRGDFYRHALITGVIFHQIDPRIPPVLSALFTQELDANQVMAQISQITGWKPSVAQIQDVIQAIEGLSGKISTGSEPDAETCSDTERVRANMKSLM